MLERDLLLVENQQLRTLVKELEETNKTLQGQLGVMKKLYNGKASELQELQFVYSSKLKEFEHQIKMAQERVAILEMRNNSLEGMLNAIFQDAQKEQQGLF